MSEILLNQEELPKWFEYPTEALLLVDQNLLDFDPWIILTDSRLRERYTGVKDRYPSRNIIPFARREDNDDLACFNKEHKIVVIHDFASAGFEGGIEEFEFWNWFRKMVEDMITHNS